MEEITPEEVVPVGLEFFNDVKWELVTNNKITKDIFLKIRAKNTKAFATFLGAQDHLSFFMFRPLSWPEFKEVRSSSMDKYEIHDFIVKNCILWPIINEGNIHTLEAGTALTLVYQILAQSSFLKDPSQALKMVIEI
jgi:hypothetical protein